MTTKKKRCIDEELLLEMVDDPERGGWIIIPPSGRGIPASLFEICLWREIIHLRTRIAYLKARLDNYEQN